MRITALAFLTLIIGICVWAMRSELATGSGQADASSAEQISGRCRRVVDGDSLYIKGHRPQIRLWGVDAPETDEPGYIRAKRRLEQLALNKNLTCLRKDTDKYGRTVARCFLVTEQTVGVDPAEINRELLNSRVAREYCRFTQGYYGHCREKRFALPLEPIKRAQD